MNKVWNSDCGRVTLYLGDALDILPALPTAHRVAVFDPPYSSGGFNEAGKSAGSIGTLGTATILNDTMSTEGYIELVRRTLRASGAHSCYVFTDWRMWGHTRTAVELAGQRVRNMLVWDKQSPGMGSRWTMQHELVLWGSRAQLVSKNAAGNVLKATRSGNANHPTEKPVGLMRQIIRNAEPGEIVDAFTGSGSTAIAALLEGRKFTGVELSPQHFDTAKRRIAETLRSIESDPEAHARTSGNLL